MVQGICPTCYDLSHDRCIFGDPFGRILYEIERFSCLLITKPRAPGRAIIISKDHCKDMCGLKDSYGAESVYLCTMCNGPMSHFHLQMIPRYSYEKRGSRNFVKVRNDYIHEPEKVKAA